MNNDITVNGVLYRQLFNTCGKPDCRCANGGEGHGPYWFAFNLGSGSGRKYIGKNLPKQVTDHLALLETERGSIGKIRAKVNDRMEEHDREYNRAKGELRAIDALLRGDHVDQNVLKSLQLERFSVNGHK